MLFYNLSLNHLKLHASTNESWAAKCNVMHEMAYCFYKKAKASFQIKRILHQTLSFKRKIKSVQYNEAIKRDLS